VAVLWKLDQQEEARQRMAILRDAGRPQASQDLQRFQEYIRRSLPYKDPEILEDLSKIWQDAEK
jgi:hypothetical protein